jgi:hypothetical protein
MSDLVAAGRNVTPAIGSVSTWNAAEKAIDLTNAIVAAHFLSCALSNEARQHIGYLEGKAVRSGLAHGWTWQLVPHGEGVISAWEALKAVRADVIEMAMRAAGCGRYSWEANPDVYRELCDAAPTVEQTVGELLAARDAEQREAA